MAWACQPSFCTQLPPHSPRSLYTLSCSLITTAKLSAHVLKDTVPARALPSAQCLCIKRADTRGFTLNGANLITKELFVGRMMPFSWLFLLSVFFLLDLFLHILKIWVWCLRAWLGTGQCYMYEASLSHILTHSNTVEMKVLSHSLSLRVWVLGASLLSGELVNTMVEHGERFISSWNKCLLAGLLNPFQTPLSIERQRRR